MRLIAILFLITLCLAPYLIAQDEDVLRPNGGTTGIDRPTTSSQSSTKGRVVIGIEGGLNINFFSAAITWDPGITNSPEAVLKTGSGISGVFGFFADFPISSSIGIQTRVAYDVKHYSNTQAGFIDALPGAGVISGQTPTVSMPTSSKVEFTMNTVAIAALVRVDLTKGLFLTAGPYLGITMGDPMRKDVLTKTDDDANTWIAVDYEGVRGQYREISRETSLYQKFLPTLENENTETSSYTDARIGLEFGIGYRIDISKTVYLAPNIRYQWMLGDLTAPVSASDISQTDTQSLSAMSIGAAGLNSLALVLQLGVQL